MRRKIWLGLAMTTAVAACTMPPAPAPAPPTLLTNGLPREADRGLYAVHALDVDTVSAINAMPGRSAINAIDGVDATAWEADAVGKPVVWLMLHFTGPRTFTQLRIRTTAMPPGTTFKVDASMDGKTWEPASGRLRNNDDSLQTKDLYGQGKFLRIRFFNSETAPASNFSIYEMAALGEDTVATPQPTTAPAPEPGVTDGTLRRYYPDWKAIPPRNVFLEANRLRFDTAIGNQGPGYLQIRNALNGSERGEAIQEILDDQFKVVERRDASKFIYFAAHGHNHVDDIARYELRAGGVDGPTLKTASKISFCVEDSYRMRDMGQTSRYPDCTPELMGVTPGYADLYSSNLPGQEFDLTDVPAGEYAMVVTVDPYKKFLDYSRSNNVAWTRIRLDPQAGTVQIIGTGGG